MSDTVAAILLVLSVGWIGYRVLTGKFLRWRSKR